MIHTTRALPAGSEGRLVVIDQMHNLVVRYQIQELRLSSEVVEDMWRGMGLDLPLQRIPSAESWIAFGNNGRTAPSGGTEVASVPAVWRYRDILL